MVFFIDPCFIGVASVAKRFIRFVIFSAALGLLGCGGNTSPPPLYVGHVATLTGPDQYAGKQAERGISLAVQEQDKEADKDKLRPIHVRHTDTRGKLEAFEGEAVRLVAVNRVVALLGGATPAEVVRLDKAQVPLLAPIGLRTRDMSDLVYLTGLAPAFQGKVLARFAVLELKVPAAVVLVDERREDALALADSFASNFSQLHEAKKPKGEVSRPQIRRFGKDRPLPDLAKALAGEKPRAILMAGTPPDLADLLRVLRPAPAPVLFGGEDGSARALLDSPDTAGVYLATAYVRDLDLPRAKEFAAAFANANSTEPDVNAALAYDSARLLFEAIRRCKNEGTSERLAKELGQLKDFPGLTGPLAFATDRLLHRPAFVGRLEKGKLATVKKYEAPEAKSEK